MTRRIVQIIEAAAQVPVLDCDNDLEAAGEVQHDCGNWGSRIRIRDSSIQRIAMNLYLSFARGLIADGIYKAYFAPGIQMVGAQVAGLITSSMVKQFVIRKGFEAAVKEIVMAGLR